MRPVFSANTSIFCTCCTIIISYTRRKNDYTHILRLGILTRYRLYFLLVMVIIEKTRRYVRTLYRPQTNKIIKLLTLVYKYLPYVLTWTPISVLSPKCCPKRRVEKVAHSSSEKCSFLVIMVHIVYYNCQGKKSIFRLSRKKNS